jgi:hypothetical protein
VLYRTECFTEQSVVQCEYCAVQSVVQCRMLCSAECCAVQRKSARAWQLTACQQWTEDEQMPINGFQLRSITAPSLSRPGHPLINESHILRRVGWTIVYLVQVVALHYDALEGPVASQLEFWMRSFCQNIGISGTRSRYKE